MSSKHDLIIRGGSVVTPERITRADVGIAGGKFVRIAPAITEAGTREIDATGLHVFPGILDAHVHFNEPGRADWEGLATGSAALAAGGGAWFCDMPLNSTPPVLDATTFDAKVRLAAAKSITDFSLWGGLVPGNHEWLPELARAGAIGVKAFMCGSGMDDFPGITDAATLRKGMQCAARLGLLVAVHAEDEAMAGRLTRAAVSRDARAWLKTRPVEVELAAIRLATELAGETQCALHIVHVSSPEGLTLVAEARRRGVKVSAETCPHYLLLNEEDLVREGTSAKCTPPLRSEAARQGLWRGVNVGLVETIGSDHSPAPPALKQSRDFFAAWGGISGVQHGFPLLLSTAVASLTEQWALPLMSALLAANVARRFRLPGKGRITEGNDADFALLDLRSHHTLNNAELLYRHRQGPYHGRPCTVRVRQTWVRGVRIWGEDGIAPGAPKGHLLRPDSIS
ncbi:MAG: allantoinase AllB, partial [Opitutales bacterium]